MVRMLVPCMVYGKKPAGQIIRRCNSGHDRDKKCLITDPTPNQCPEIIPPWEHSSENLLKLGAGPWFKVHSI